MRDHLSPLMRALLSGADALDARAAVWASSANAAADRERAALLRAEHERQLTELAREVLA